VRRIVTGWSEGGEPTVLFDGELHGRADTAAREWELLPPPRGSAFRIAVYPPGAEVAEHSTETLDYVVVIEGRLTLLLGGRELELGPGDAVVQQGTPHGSENRGTERCVIAAVLLSTVA
jgi:quercetin dioxygenase-like cupin family protein